MCETERAREQDQNFFEKERERERYFRFPVREKKNIENGRLFSFQEFYSLRRRRLKSANRGVNRDSARMLTTIRGEDRY